MSWRDSALCAQVDPEIWFPERGESNRAALAICRACPVRQECLQNALAFGDEYGVWGGTTSHDRRAMPKSPRRGPNVRRAS